MHTISTSCAYCSRPLVVSIWAFIPPPTDIYCAHCNGRNNVTLYATSVAVVTLMGGGLAGAYLAAPFNHPSKFAFEAGFVIGWIVVAPLAAYLASRRPQLVRYFRWWIPRPPTIDAADEVTMRELGIGFNGEYFSVAGLDFDKLKDAVAHAVAKQRDAA